jgi:hypothetical protein
LQSDKRNQYNSTERRGIDGEIFYSKSRELPYLGRPAKTYPRLEKQPESPLRSLLRCTLPKKVDQRNEENPTLLKNDELMQKFQSSIYENAFVFLTTLMMINHERYIEISFLRYFSTHLCNQNQKQLSRARDFAKRV